jgi:hypothetical protein
MYLSIRELSIDRKSVLADFFVAEIPELVELYDKCLNENKNHLEK